MADEISPLNLTVGEPVTPMEMEPAKDDTYGLGKGRLLYEQQMQKLMEALDRRRQMPFDPMWMRVAAGFAKPTKTGSFFESLGYAAEGAADEAEKELARKTDIEKLKMEIAGKQYGMAKQAAGMKMLGELNKPKSGAPMPQPDDGMSTEQVVDVVKKNPNALDQITLSPERVAAISAVDESFGKIAEQLYKNQVERAKIEMGRYEVNAQGDVFDKATNQVVKYGSRMVEVASPFDPDVKMPIRAADLDSYSKLDFSKPAEVNAWLRKHGLNAYAIGKEGKPTVEGEEPITGTPTEGKTKSQRETEKTIREERAKSDIKRDEEEKKNIFSRQEQANSSLLPTAKALYSYASNPETAKAFDYLNKQGLMSAAVSLAENGITVGNWRIGLTDVKKALRQAGFDKASQKDIDTVQIASQYITRLQLDMAKADAKGSISNYEDQLFERANISSNDTAKIVAMKSELLIQKARMDDFIANKYSEWAKKNPQGYVSDFKQTPEFRKLLNQYNKKLDEVQAKYGFGFSMQDVK